MNIFSKQLLYAPSSTPTTPPVSYAYEAYYIHNDAMTLLGNVTDLSKTFSPQDEFIYTNLFVYEGYLYYNGTKSNISTVTYLTGRSTSTSYYIWLIDNNGVLFRCKALSNGIVSLDNLYPGTFYKVCGYSNGTMVSFAEKNNGLYYDGTTKISTLTNWTKITGYGDKNSANYYGYGINEGKLYYLYANGNGVIQQGTDTTWTDITGCYENGSWYGYGINAGKLYALAGAPTQIGTDTTWTKVSGTASTGSNAYSLGINNGKLYRINGTTATQLGSATDWENCSGFARSSIYGLATASDGLYRVSASGGRTRLSALTDWVYIGGNYDSSDAYAVAIRRVQQ